MSDQDAVTVAQISNKAADGDWANSAAHRALYGYCNLYLETHGPVCMNVAAALRDAFARGLAAREGVLSREDVAAWLDKLAAGHLQQLQQNTFESSINLMSGALIGVKAAADAVRNGAIEAWLASRAKGACAWELCGVPKTMRANVEHMREWLGMGRVNLNGAWYCNERCRRAKGGTAPPPKTCASCGKVPDPKKFNYPLSPGPRTWNGELYCDDRCQEDARVKTKGGTP